MSRFLGLGAVNAFLAVAAGAFAAHALRARLDADRLAVFETGARYHMFHALGLFAVALVAVRAAGTGGAGSGTVAAAGWLMLAGIVLFSGSLYALALSGQRWLGAVTPLGGLCFLASWALLAWAAFRG
jgi:uncharacterized membrane protein YgdD (TMEM256/DUF423 family)